MKGVAGASEDESLVNNLLFPSLVRLEHMSLVGTFSIYVHSIGIALCIVQNGNNRWHRLAVVHYAVVAFVPQIEM